MIALTDRSQFVNAEKKARQVKPVVTMVEFGVYVVWGSATNYTVEFGKDKAGHFAATCTCPAHTLTATPKPCYHLVAAYMAHKLQVGIRKAVRVAEAALVPSVANWTIESKEAA